MTSSLIKFEKRLKVETNENIYKLSEEQKRELEAMENLSDEDFMTSEEFHKNIKLKYGL